MGISITCERLREEKPMKMQIDIEIVELMVADVT